MIPIGEDEGRVGAPGQRAMAVIIARIVPVAANLALPAVPDNRGSKLTGGAGMSKHVISRLVPITAYRALHTVIYAFMMQVAVSLSVPVGAHRALYTARTAVDAAGVDGFIAVWSGHRGRAGGRSGSAVSAGMDQKVVACLIPVAA